MVWVGERSVPEHRLESVDGVRSIGVELRMGIEMIDNDSTFKREQRWCTYYLRGREVICHIAASISISYLLR